MRPEIHDEERSLSLSTSATGSEPSKMAAHEETKPEPPTGMKEYPIAGHLVKFPRQPYGAQIVFMQKLISAIHNRTNALLEAPTGCGKTLAILCGALAWQSKVKQEADDMEAAVEVDIYDLQLTQGSALRLLVESPRKHRMDVYLGSPLPSQALPRHARDPHELDAGRLPDEALDGAPKGRPGAPRIYYATRTHSQIAQATQANMQVANELKITGYTPKMAILGGRKHYCINDTVRESDTNIDDACKDKCDSKGGCEVYKKERIPFQASRAPPVHDIEDLVQYGKNASACPFYMSRDLFSTAELVFCPYNYIVDPGIRSSMQIDLAGAVIIFDEAHNIEDAAREAASIDVTLEEVEAALLDTTSSLDHEEVGGDFRQLQGTLARLRTWLQRFSIDPAEDLRSARASFENLCRPRGTDITAEQRKSHGLVKTEGQRLQCVWSGGQIRTHLSEAGLDPASNSDTKACIQNVKKQLDDGGKDEQTKADKSGSLAIAFLESLMATLSMVYGMVEQGPDAHDASDYRLVVSAWKEQPVRRARSRFVRQDSSDDKPCVQLSLWCMNPGCAFREIGDKARSVIVTSGTLSPMVSFASELGIPFPGTPLTTGHVVPQDQVLPMVLSRSPRHHVLRATLKESEDLRFQDGVLEALQSIAQVVPDGMLVFMPSYGMLNKLFNRWETHGSLQQLRQIKPVWKEPQGGSAEELEESIQEYYAAIKEGRGGIFFAVCRGKVSEGINFADEHARAVVLLGIPFPAFKDIKVEQKKAYNDHKDSQARGLVTGNKWYSLQAFRAMNQALGRCIRHKQDYGAIILMDERMLETGKQCNLSEWVRKRMGTRAIDFRQAHSQLGAFFEHCKHKMHQQREGAMVKDEKPLLKAELKGEQLQVKDEQQAAKDGQDTADAPPAAISTQELWTEAPKGKQRVTVAQSLTRAAARAPAESGAAPTPAEHGAAPSAAAGLKKERTEHEDVQIVASEAAQKQRGKERAGKKQATLYNAFQKSAQEAAGASKPAAEACGAAHPDAVTPCAATAETEQNSAPNGQLLDADCAARGSDDGGPHGAHAAQSHAQPQRGFAQQPVLIQQHEAQHMQPQPAAGEAICASGTPPCGGAVTPPALPAARCAPCLPPHAAQGHVAHGCHAADASTASPLSAHQSQMFTQTPGAPGMCGLQLSAVPMQVSSGILYTGAAGHSTSHWGAAQRTSWGSPSVPQQAGGAAGPPAPKAQKLSHAGAMEYSRSSTAPALHPADVQLLESGFLDSDSEEEAAAAQPGSTAAAHPPHSAAGIPMFNLSCLPAQPPPPPLQGQGYQAPVHSYLPGAQPPGEQIRRPTPPGGPGPLLRSPAVTTPAGECPNDRTEGHLGAVPVHAACADPWRSVCMALCTHDARFMASALQQTPPWMPPGSMLSSHTVHNALLQNLDEAYSNSATMLEWCSAWLSRGQLLLGVAVAVRHANHGCECTEIHPELDVLLTSTDVVVPDNLVTAVLGPMTLEGALRMLHSSYASLQSHVM